MPRFSRKTSEKQSKGKGEAAEKKKEKKAKKGKGKEKAKEEADGLEEDELQVNGYIGVQQCRRLLAQCSTPQKKSAKCLATFRRNSRLSKNLMGVLLDDAVLPYFMEYMEKQNAMNLLNFWLTAETFRLSTINRLKINSVSRLKAANQTDDGNGIVKNNSTDATENVEGVSADLNSALGDSGIGGVFSSPNSSGSADGFGRDDNDDFGFFASYVPSQCEMVNSSGHSTGTQIPAVILTCHSCGRQLSSSSTCTNCNASGSGSRTNSGLDRCSNTGTITGNVLPTHQMSTNDTLSSSSRDCPDGQPNHCTELPVAKYTTNSCENQVQESTKGRGLRVKFDLTPDYDDRQREFCRRRTRSIVIDALSIYTKYISLDSTHPFGLEESLRRQIEVSICSEDGRIDPDCFIPAQRFAFDVMDRMYFPTFRQSSFYCKHQVDILTSGKIFLDDILYNETSMFYFMEFLDREGIRHMLEFWMAADSFHSHFKAKLEGGEYVPEETLDDAMILYNKYFSMQAVTPLGVDDVTRIEIENSICREGGPLPDCFELPMENVLCLLEEVFFPSFLQSEVYFKYLSELLNSVTEHEASLSSADSVEDNSRPDQLNEKSRLVTSHGSELDLSENPDAIWQRPNARPLTLGRVNEFGIFEPFSDPDPDSDHTISTAAKLGRAMRKLVKSGAEDKAKEEMAWKIAKMIIEDVKSDQDRTGPGPNVKSTSRTK